MKIHISTSEYEIEENSKELLVYCDGKLNIEIDFKKDNIIDIDDNVSMVKILCKSHARKEISSKIAAFLLSLLSMIFGSNGSEVLTYIYDDILELELSGEDIYIKYFSKYASPFYIQKGNSNVLSNYRSVDRNVFINWICAVIVPMMITLISGLYIFIISSKYLWLTIPIILVVSAAGIYLIKSVNKAYSFVNKV